MKIHSVSGIWAGIIVLGILLAGCSLDGSQKSKSSDAVYTKAPIFTGSSVGGGGVPTSSSGSRN